MIDTFPDDFKTVRIFQMISHLPHGFKTVQIFPDDCQFSGDFKTVRIFQMITNFPDDFKIFCPKEKPFKLSQYFQNDPDFYRLFPTFQMV